MEGIVCENLPLSTHKYRIPRHTHAVIASWIVVTGLSVQSVFEQLYDSIDHYLLPFSEYIPTFDLNSIKSIPYPPNTRSPHTAGHPLEKSIAFHPNSF
jgi:hypothetical protein